MSVVADKYLRLEKMPHIWCPGCGNGIILHAVIRAIDQMGWPKDDVVVVSGIGCSARTSGYLDFNTVQTTHGRALGFAMGIKLAKPHLHVIVFTGDGDGCGIGGNHLIHAARRNIDITVIMLNNSIYGMTGGQYSPLTPPGKKATTAPYGNVEYAFDICEVARAAGASYVARGTAYHARALAKLIKKGLENKGFSFIEAVTQCPVGYGAQNKFSSPAAMLKWQRDHAVSINRARQMQPEELNDKFIIGELWYQPRPEFTEQYQEIREKAIQAAKPKKTLITCNSKTPSNLGLAGMCRLRLAGFGGQGLVLGGLILSEAAVLEGKQVAFTQSYGPEARGGASRSETIISDSTIYYPEIEVADVLLAMTQEALDKYASEVEPEGMIIVDSDLVKNVNEDHRRRVYALPLTAMARQELGKEVVANIIALGAIAALTGVVSRDALEKSVLNRVPVGTEEINLRALDIGYNLVAKALGGGN